jgi:hypothetical protein
MYSCSVYQLKKTVVYARVASWRFVHAMAANNGDSSENILHNGKKLLQVGLNIILTLSLLISYMELLLKPDILTSYIWT